MSDQHMIAMTPAQYELLTGSESPCNVSQGIVCIDNGKVHPNHVLTVKAITDSLESAQEIATQFNNKH